jgi:hypothetical protein
MTTENDANYNNCDGAKSYNFTRTIFQLQQHTNPNQVLQ